MADDYTRKGHKLVHEKDLIFACHARTVGFAQAQGQFQSNFVLAQLGLWAPSTRAEILATLRAWLSVYADEELLDRVEAVVDAVFSQLPEAKAGTPSAAPQGNQAN